MKLYKAMLIALGISVVFWAFFALLMNSLEGLSYLRDLLKGARNDPGLLMFLIMLGVMIYSISLLAVVMWASPDEYWGDCGNNGYHLANS